MPTRRALLAAGLAAASRALAAPDEAAPLPPDLPAVLPLWPGAPPGGGGPAGPVSVDGRGAWSGVARPGLVAFPPARPGRGAVLVAGGGGYRRIGMGREAFPAARWLAGLGVAAYALAYRLPPEGWAGGPLAPLQDALRALRLLRAGVAGAPPPERVAVLGFSAGGHLMGLAAARSGFASYAPVDAADRLPARADAAALIYPVITLEPPHDGTVTRRSLVGREPAPGAAAAWSVETHVGPGCPPVFLAQAADDPVSDPANSRIMAAACRRAGVPVDLTLFPSGGHGFGLGRPGTPPAAWPDLCAAWLHHQGIVG